MKAKTTLVKYNMDVLYMVYQLVSGYCSQSLEIESKTRRLVLRLFYLSGNDERVFSIIQHLKGVEKLLLICSFSIEDTI